LERYPSGALAGPLKVTHLVTKVHPATTLPQASLAATLVVVNAVPAVAPAGAVTTKWSRPAALTLTVALPVALLNTTSLTTTVWLAAVFSTMPFAKVCDPESPAPNV
jgi:hypothetical protein